MNTISISPQITEQVRFCPICSKAFWQETSFIRHVQYCRRRHNLSSDKAPRQKSCHACSQAKTKCDLNVPCSRCLTRKMSCIYATRAGTLTAESNTPISNKRYDFNRHLLSREQQGKDYSPAPLADTLWNWSWDITDSPTEIQKDPSSIFQPLDYSVEHSYRDSFDDQDLTNRLVMPSAVATGTPSSSFLDSTTLMERTSSATCERDGQFMRQSHSRGIGQSSYETTESRTTLQPQSSLNPETLGLGIFSPIATRPCEGLQSVKAIPDSCRVFISSVLKCYPNMLVQKGIVPPLIHHIVPELANADKGRPDLSRNGGIYLSEPLAVCSSISSIFLARNPNTVAFLWRTIDAEQRRLREQANQLSRDETLAAAQAIVIYSIMLYTCDGPEYSLKLKELIITLDRLLQCLRMWRHDSDNTAFKLDWRHWVFEEALRRTAIVCFLIGLIILPRPCTSLTNSGSIPLPCSKALWEANDRNTWQKEYDLTEIAPKPDGPQPRTMGDLVSMLDEASKFKPQSVTSGVDAWITGQDELGMLILAVASNNTATP